MMNQQDFCASGKKKDRVQFVSWLISHFEKITEELTKRYVYAERVAEARGENNQGT